MHERVPVGWLLPLRLVMGAILVIVGWQKLTGGWMHGAEVHNALGGWLTQNRPYTFFRPIIETARAHPKIFGTLVTIGELAIGASFVLGVFTRPASFMGLLLLASIALGGGESLKAPGTAFVMSVVCLTFLFTAPGRFLGIDQALQGKLPRWLV